MQPLKLRQYSVMVDDTDVDIMRQIIALMMMARLMLGAGLILLLKCGIIQLY